MNLHRDWIIPTLVALLTAAACPASSAGAAPVGGSAREPSKFHPSEVDRLTKEGDRGSLEAQLALAQIYLDGKYGVAKNEAEGIKWLKMAAQQGSPEACNNLGLAYQKGMGVPADDQESFRWFQQAADKGLMEGHLNLGSAYINGRGVTLNRELAIKHFKEAARKGSVVAVNSLAAAQASGQGVDEITPETVKLLRTSAELGNTEAQFNMGKAHELGLGGTPKDLDKAREWYAKAAAQGMKEAQQRVKELMDERQSRGEKVALPKGLERLRQEAEWGDARAQRKLGDLFLSGGEGVKKDAHEGARWIAMAANKGDAEAQLRLSLLHLLGDGVEKSVVKAYMWAEVAGNSSRVMKQKIEETLLKKLEKELTPEQISQAKQEAGAWRPSR
ncbi:MAG: sel1 repeat family protein [Magnetococcales bacterium]|nr:sel1 repeat family protein [Magnetococcales bacterium]